MAHPTYKSITTKLEEIASTTSATEFVYDLLRIFGDTTETSINRIKDGKGNMAKDGVTVLAKFGKPMRVIAYRPATADTLNDELETLQTDKKVLQSKARLMVVSDGRRVMAYDPKEDEVYDNDIATLWKDYGFFMPLAGVEKFVGAQESDADVKASYIMARIYDDIRRYNDISDDQHIHHLNVFLTRLLFCFFAEDTDIFEEGLFTESIRTYTNSDGSDLKDYIEGAFDIMSIESPIVRERMPKAICQFPYVNGGLFKEHYPVPNLSRRTRDLILKCGGFNWSEINPDIFGSMIQAVIRPEDRAGLGLHYTSVPNILKVIRPLFLDALYEEFVNGKDSIRKLNELLIRLSKIKFFDPACGSGNFLIIAYKELRRLEILIWEQLRDLRKGQVLIPISEIKLTQFYGIEIDEFAQETATLSLWLAEHQMNRLFSSKLGYNIDALPLRPSGHIVHGNACRLDWSAVCPHTADDEVYIMGNPPYLGSSKLDKEQQDDRTYAIGQLQNYKKIDYIGIWLIKGANYIQSTISKCAFVSTNSICQGEMVEPLWSPIFSKDVIIDFAYTSFKWGNNAKYNAGVTCVIIGLANNIKQKRMLITGDAKREVVNINPYLTEGSSLIVSKHTTSISHLPQIIRGCMPYDGGNLLLSLSEKDSLVAEHPQAEKYIKKIYSAADYINGLVRFCLWISDDDRSDAESIPFIHNRIRKTAEMRLKSPDEGARNLANRPHQFREFNACDGNTLIIPSTSSANRNYIPIGYADANTIVTNAMYSVFDAPIWVFGIVTSIMSMLWMKTIGGKLKTDYRYTNLCYNSFPFPKITEQQRAELERYAETVLMTRENHTEMTLAQMYDPDSMPLDLRDAHRALDLAVERCYRPEPFTSDEERLEHLFRLYEKMTKK